jgi:hypothetical protein
VSYVHPALRALFARVDALKSQGLPQEKLLARLRLLVRRSLRLLPPVEAGLTRRSRARGASAELGEFAALGFGGTREAALVAHLALQRAGFAPKLSAVRSWRQLTDGRRRVEDRIVNLIHTERGQAVFDPGRRALDGRRLTELLESRAGAGIERELESEAPRVFTPVGKPKMSGVEVRVEAETPLTFELLARTAAEKRFKAEEQAFRAAKPEDPVAVEWIYLPAYVPDGHTALRVGETIYELGRAGWRAHNARAFLFNNPFLDARHAQYGSSVVPPFSVGAPLTVPKRAADAVVAAAEAERKAGARFSLWFHNCNQVFVRFFKEAGVDLGGGPVTRFSSVRYMRSLLLRPSPQSGKPRLYMLPNQASQERPLHELVPRALYTPRSALRDALYFVWWLPRSARDLFVRRFGGGPRP